MARPKQGLDYFEMDCHVQLIEAEFGLKGFAIVVKLFQHIYSGYGYYCEWTPEISVLWADRLGCSHGGEPAKGRKGNVVKAFEKGSLTGFPKNLINEVVEASIRRGIFSSTLFQKYHILTSEEIQMRYLDAVSNFGKVELKKEYLLVNCAQNFENLVIDGNLCTKTKESVLKTTLTIKDTNPSKSSLDKIGERDSISKRAILTREEKEKLMQEFGEEIVEDYIRRTTPYKCCNYATIRKWIIEDKGKKPRRNNFSNFPQRNYGEDRMSELEQSILKKNKY